MATMKKGVLVRAGEWWKHLRATKRTFWKKHRKAEARLARREAGEPLRAGSDLPRHAREFERAQTCIEEGC